MTLVGPSIQWVCFALRWEATQQAAAAIAAAERQKYLLNLAFTTHTQNKSARQSVTNCLQSMCFIKYYAGKLHSNGPPVNSR